MKIVLCLTVFCWLYGVLVVTGTTTRQARLTKELRASFWKTEGQAALTQSINKFDQLNKRKAKNVIVMIGDGMSLATSTAGRVYMGQKRSGYFGEEFKTAIDKLPHVGVLKTYTLNKQTSDSAGTATAILTGVKTRSGLVGVSGRATSCAKSLLAVNRLTSVLEKAAAMGKSTGIVTTTRVQHATPASAYAKSASRGWMDDRSNTGTCKDIALQLYEKRNDIQVILGGGTLHMEVRSDGRNLTQEWIQSFATATGINARYVTTRQQLNAVNPATTNRLMGLFAPGEMGYRLDGSLPASEPTLTEMVSAAVKILKRNPNGFFLLVEGGLIDKGHHLSKPKYALEEFQQLDNSVTAAQSLTSDSETLLVVTADHGHMFMFGSNSNRGNPVAGLAESAARPSVSKSRRYYPSVIYGNGPGYSEYSKIQWRRANEARGLTESAGYVAPSAVWLRAETHSAEDVLSFASGPMAHLLNGVHEQTHIAHVVSYAACMDPPSVENRAHCLPPATSTTTN